MALQGALRASEPRRVGPFRLLSRLGTGGMGVVYLGESETSGQAAVKVVRQDLADDPSFRTRFEREVSNAKQVSGNYTARLIDADVQGDPPWLATEFIAGPTLHEAVTSGERFHGEVLRALAVGLADALAAIHAKGIVHRDLKPANIILADDGPRVVDFGIARALDATAMTHTGTMLGSPAFMAPEQVSGDEQTPAVDVFAWAGTLVFAATGEGPFGGGEPQGVMYRVVNQPPRLAGVDPELAPLLQRALDKRPERRPTISQVVTELTGGDDDPAAVATLVTATWVQPVSTTIQLPMPDSGEEDQDSRRRRWPLVLALGVLLAAAGIGVAVALMGAGQTEPANLPKAAPPFETMPNLSGETAGDAAAVLRNLGLSSEVEERPSADVEEGRVIGQSPDPKTAVAPGSTVTLVVSTGPAEVDVPDLVGVLAFPAVARLQELDLTATTVEQSSDNVDTGAVIAQTPAAGTTVEVGSNVELVVSTGPAALSASLVGNTDLDPSHWTPSLNEADQQLPQRVFGNTDWTLVDGFPVTMNGCASRQIRVGWRSVGGPVQPAIASYWDPTVGPIIIEQEGVQATEGTMILNGCEQPAYKTPGGDLIDIVVESSVFSPAVGG